MTNKRNLFQSSLTAKYSARFPNKRAKPSDEGLNDEDYAELRTNNPVNTPAEAISVITKILSNGKTGYQLIPWKKFAKNWKKRTLIYCEFHVLVHFNTMQDAGWAVCNQVMEGVCKVENGTKRYQPKVSNAAFHRHIESHKNAGTEQDVLVTVSEDRKKIITEAAAKASALDLLPLSFCDSKHRGVRQFADALIQLGQCYATTAQIDVGKLLPCGNSIRKGILDLSDKLRLEFKEKLPTLLENGGGISCDGVKLESNGRKYYDFVMNYIEFGRKSLSNGGGITWKFVTRLLFIINHSGAESADAIAETLNNRLSSSYGLKLSDFQKRFTFVTDSAAVMPKVFGASVSQKKVPYGERWLPCITHQINTVMKTVIQSPKIKDSEIFRNLNCVKKIVSTIKHAGLNEKLPDGFAFLQEVETRFGTTYDVVKRFLKSESQISHLGLLQNDNESTKKIKDLLSSLTKVENTDGSKTFPALESIITCFAPMRHAQTELEASTRPTLIKVLPMIEDVKSKLVFLASGICSQQTYEPPHECTKLLAQCTLDQLRNVYYHDMWCAATLIHPGLYSFHFMPKTSASECRIRGETLIRKMLIQYQESKCDTSSHSSAEFKSDTITTVGACLGEAKWALSDKMSFVAAPRQPTDELHTFLSMQLSDSDISLLKEDNGIVEFWATKTSSLPHLHRIALRILVTPASSTPSERDFSLLKLIVDPRRCRMKDDIIDATAQVRSANQG